TAMSSEFMRHWIADFGNDEPPLLYSEYGDADGDGLPNWFEMYWFGKFLDMSTASIADPSEDSNGSGHSNLEEYLRRRNPIVAREAEPEATSLSTSALTEYLGAPFHGQPMKIPGRIQAQDFDHGGRNVAYHETINYNS